MTDLQETHFSGRWAFVSGGSGVHGGAAAEPGARIHERLRHYSGFTVDGIRKAGRARKEILGSFLLLFFTLLQADVCDPSLSLLGVFVLWISGSNIVCAFLQHRLEAEAKRPL
jgi:hypothetical protein